ncbi:MAG: cytochrome b/b6 domain-containing protein [Rhizobiales bacterium]|nr:cytochrome b/b6 domain-containing protein [Hyphomicrobiales bacterium]
MIYSRYERFWHWSQAALIFTLAFSGFVVHGSFALIGFDKAVMIHTIAAVVLILLWIFTTFWHFTTGQWRQYLPKTGLLAVVRFYAWGILRGAPHPYSKNLWRKQNALQSLAYLTFMVLIGPALWATGILYLAYPLWAKLAGATGLTVVAFVHTAAAFMMIAFVIIHVYMTTTGKTVGHYVKTMITGYDTVEMAAVEEAYLERQQPNILR